MKTDDIVKIIEAIGNIWPFMLTLFLIIIILIKWKTIWKGFGNINKFTIKSSVADVEVSTQQAENAESNKKEIQETQEPKVILDEENQKGITLIDCHQKLSEADIAGAISIFEKIQKESPKEKLFENEIIFLYYKFLNGYSESINEFNEKLNNENLGNDDKYLGYYYLGFCYKRTNINLKAISAFESAISFTKEERKITNCKIYIAQVLAKSENSDSALDFLIEYLKTVKLENSKVQIYREISNIYKERKDYILQISSLEKAIEITSNDTSLLFELAYAYSQIEYEEPSIFNYSNLLYFKSNHDLGLNNIGVSFKKSQLPLKAAEYYKRAVESKNSLAAGNLAYIYIGAGLEQEALELFDKFKNEKDISQMLVDAHKSLIESKEREEEGLKEIKDTGRKVSNFFRDYAKSFFGNNMNLSYSNNSWTDDENNNIEVEIKNGVFKICWSKQNHTLEDLDNYIISGKIDKNGYLIEFEIPNTIIPNMLKIDIFSSDRTKKAFREVQKYSGYCSIDLNEKKIKILYLKNKTFQFKEIFGKPSA